MMLVKFILSLMISMAFVSTSYAEQANSDNVGQTPSGAGNVTNPNKNLDSLSRKPANLTTKYLDQYPGECQIAVQDVEELCWKEGRLQEASAAIASARDQTTGLTGIIEGASNDSQLGAIAHLNAAKDCQAAIASCTNNCSNANVSTYQPQDVQGQEQAQLQANSDARVRHKQEAKRYCEVSDKKVGLLAKNAVMMFNQSNDLQAMKKQLDTGKDSRSFYEKHQTAVNIAGGAAIAIGAYKFGKSKGEDDGKKSAIKNLRKSCLDNGKYKSLECKNEYLAVCSSDPKAEGCYAFTNHYCGITGNTAQATGADTKFCDSMNAYRYCQQDGAANSPTCVERRVQAGTCQSDKAVDPSLECRIYNHQQLAQQVCQSYPSDPLCRRVLSSGSSYGSTAPSSGASAAAAPTNNSAVMGYAMSSSNSSNVIPNNRKPSSQGDVSCAACASVFSQISRVAQEYCKTGQLYGCYKK